MCFRTADISHFNHLRTRLAGFRLLVLPVVQAMSTEDAELLAAWVRNGGTLVAVDWAQTAMCAHSSSHAPDSLD